MAGMTANDIDLYEVNEAFASVVVMRFHAAIWTSRARTTMNVNGGAIAMGHPLGAPRARCCWARRWMNWKARGTSETALVITLCVGGGMGTRHHHRDALRIVTKHHGS